MRAQGEEDKVIVFSDTVGTLMSAVTKIVVEEGVPVVTTGAGNPGKYIPAWKAAGIKVIPVVAAAVLAKPLEPLGIDAVMAEGTESGGHVGEMATMALVPQEMCIRDSIMSTGL